MIVGETFCFWDSQTIFDAIIMSLDTCISAVLLGLVVKSYMKARIVLKEGVLKFYYLMMLWGCSFIGKDVFGVVVYFAYYWPRAEQQHEPEMQTIITRNSKIYQLVDALPGVLVQTLLLMISLNILANLIAYGLLKDRKVQFMYSAGRVYFWARLLILLPGVVLFGHFQLEVVNTLSEIKVGLIVVDSMVCMMFLFVLQWKQIKHYQPLDGGEDFMQPLRKQLFLLVIATISRAVINIFNTLITPRIVYAILDRTDCFYGKDFKVETVIFTITYIFMGDILMHFVPIYLIRSMYQPPS